jgi:nucleoside-diphosphate-sugar epimerase
MTVPLHVVFGAGQVGQPLAHQLMGRGLRVRVARRSASAPVPAGCEVAVGDATDPAFCRDAAGGAAVVYNCMNPPYVTATWAEQIPRYTENLIAAAGGTGARLVVLDNLYALAPPRGRSLDEDSPIGPVSRKGAIRAQAAQRVADAHSAGEVVAVSGRASDFYGPGGTLTGLGDFFWPRALA